MYIRHELGKIGEDLAVQYIKKKGYKVIERNYRTPYGEIDIIAYDNDVLVFIEVKTRSQNRYGSPAEAITKIKAKHIYRSAEYYVLKHHLEKASIRFDVIEIMKEKGNTIIHKISNAIF